MALFSGGIGIKPPADAIPVGSPELPVRSRRSALAGSESWFGGRRPEQRSRGAAVRRSRRHLRERRSAWPAVRAVRGTTTSFPQALLEDVLLGPVRLFERVRPGDIGYDPAVLGEGGQPRQGPADVGRREHRHEHAVTA